MMKFIMKGRMVFSKSIDNLGSEIDRLIADAQSTLFKAVASSSRQQPAGEVQSTIPTSITKYELKNEVMTFEMVSEGSTRPHNEAVRLRKYLATALGTSHKIGVRNLSIDNYEIEMDTEKPPLKAVRIPFAKSVEFKETTCRIVLDNISQEFLDNNYIDRIIKLVKEKVAAQYYEGKAEHWELLWASREKEMLFNGDPTEAMLERKWLKQGPTKGKWFFRPQAARILRTMEKIAMEEILLPMGFQECIAPHHVPFETWIRSGHMFGIANEAYYVVEPRTRNTEEWEEFYDMLKITRTVPTELLAKMLSPPKAGLCYAQCPNIYWSFQGATLADDSLPLLILEKAQISNRYESGGRHGIERVDEFHRIEAVYIGTPEHLKNVREEMISRYKHVFEDILDLEWRMAWVRPFYMAQSGQFGVEDEIDKIKGTIDFEAYLPYRGTRKESEWLEFQNLTVAGKKFTEAFNIKGQKAELWSGCSGIGLERWTVAFLAQKGLDPEKWPAPFRKYFGQMPKGFVIL